MLHLVTGYTGVLATLLDGGLTFKSFVVMQSPGWSVLPGIAILFAIFLFCATVHYARSDNDQDRETRGERIRVLV
jgi:uncharacterized membrane protein